MITFIDRLVCYSVFLLLFLVTLLDGARNPIVFSVFFVAIHSLLLLWVIVHLRQLRLYEVVSEFRAPLAILLLWLGYGLAQTYGIAGLVTVDPYASYQHITVGFGYLSTFLLLLLVLSNTLRIKVLIVTIVSVALIQTVFGLANYYNQGTVIGWMPGHFSTDRVTGFYKNRNFFANLLLMCIGFVLVPLMQGKEKRSTSKKNITHSRSPENLTRTPVIVSAAVAVVLLAGLVLSGSRAANLTFALLLAFTALFVMIDRKSKLNIWGLTSAIGITILVFGTGILSLRMQSLAEGFTVRMSQWQESLKLARDMWIIGYGPGSYETAFKTRTGGELGPLTFNYAHNDYLEMMVEQGVIGGLLSLSFIILIFVKIFRKYLKSGSMGRKTALLSVLFAVGAMHIHALGDSPFQVPANVVFYLCIVTIGLSASVLKNYAKP